MDNTRFHAGLRIVMPVCCCGRWSRLVRFTSTCDLWLPPGPAPSVRGQVDEARAGCGHIARPNAAESQVALAAQLPHSEHVTLGTCRGVSGILNASEPLRPS